MLKGNTMATWGVHMRIADSYIARDLIENPTEFVLGSVAPDCGYGVKDSFGDFNPPPEITHWAPGGIKVYCEYWRFRNEYLQREKFGADYEFYLGYYIHLLTDILWSTMMYLPTKLKYAEEYKKDPEFLKTIKVDWYDLDYKFLRDNPDFLPYKLLKENKSVKDYLPYYETGQLTVQTRFISDYYSDYSGRTLDRDYNYLTEEQMNNFIACATDLIDYDLKLHGLINFTSEEKAG